MATKAYDSALDFMPEKKTGGTGVLGFLKTVLAAFTDARSAAARYEVLVNRGVPAGRAARMAFDTVYEQR